MNKGYCKLLLLILSLLLFSGCGSNKVESGNVWIVDSTKPTENTSAKNGDMYLDTSTYNLYQKQEDSWIKVGNIAGKDGADGEDGKDGKDGLSGKDAVSPVVGISKTGYWIVNGVTTNIKAIGQDGKNGINGTNGIDGETPTIDISKNGYWIINGKVTDIKAKGEDGTDGKDGADGKDAISPTIEINESGYWVINGKTTDVKAKGEDGKDGVDGKTPTIEVSEDDYWVINGIKTNIDAGKRTICKAVTESEKTTGNVPQGNFEAGDEYVCEVKEGVSYRFFVVGKDDTTKKVNLIMERDIASDGTVVTSLITKANSKDGVYTVVPWISGYDYEKANVDGTECSNSDPASENKFACNDEGPITALNYLYNATKDWIYLDEIEEGIYTRLPLNKETPKYDGTNLWLYNYLKNHPKITGEGLKNITGIAGYWTSEKANETSNHRANFVSNYGQRDWTVVTGYDTKSVRPVISIYMSHID